MLVPAQVSKLQHSPVSLSPPDLFVPFRLLPKRCLVAICKTTLSCCHPHNAESTQHQTPHPARPPADTAGRSGRPLLLPFNLGLARRAVLANNDRPAIAGRHRPQGRGKSCWRQCVRPVTRPPPRKRAAGVTSWSRRSNRRCPTRV